ncbi:TetR/AcrR family transcriptional regulator [Pararobbsia silviterrae]|uniref:TetR/AcrR family transcriptional regulator n=1 Tax=Pararobbsia silviterrae TaxID=1792498 RepID=A0A494XPV7_9BURK|nr:TetR/AcrR family transcriptional regulator [Pararobbsia silviterrae]RKP51741.1 TetR/AcrR family transcriptional regulator [Pararobbsia silviterrae]
MDNASRSERSRNIAIQAALVILTRDGPGGLTFDALARESGISKGGLLHQFRSKAGVLTALLQYQREMYGRFATDYLVKAGAKKRERTLAAQISVLRESINQPHSVARAVLAALVEDANLLEDIKNADDTHSKIIKKEAADPDMAMLRLAAARGLAYNALLGLCPMSSKQRDRLFERLLDEDYWSKTGSGGASID